MNEAFQQAFGFADAFLEIHMAGGLDLNFIESAFDKFEIPLSRLEEFLPIYYRELKKESAKGTELLPGVLELLQGIEKFRGVFQALGTGNLEQGARIKLDLFELNRFFPVGGFCQAPVERFYMLQEAVENSSQYYQIPFLPEQVIVIGDTVQDVRAARSIHARVIAVATGGNSFEELRREAPDLLLQNLTERGKFIDFIRAGMQG